MEFYKRVEPTEPPINERLVLGDASTPRLRFSSSNGLGDVSTALGCLWPRLGWGEALGCFPYFGVLCSPWFPPCFNTPRLPVASNRRLRNLAAPRAGRIGHCLKKVAAADSGFPEVFLGVLGNPPLGWSSPSVVPVGDFRGGLTFGPCWAAGGLPAPCAFGILWGWNIRAVCRGGVPAVR